MRPQQETTRNGRRSPTSQPATVPSELDRLRATRRRQAHAIDTLTETPEALEARLALDVHASAAARIVVRQCLGGRVALSVLERAELLVSELVTNSLCQSGASAGAAVVVRVQRSSTIVRLEVEDSGRSGVIAPRSPDPEAAGGFGLNVVQAISERWGHERVAAGGTRVWAQISLIAEASGVAAGARSSRNGKPAAGPERPSVSGGQRKEAAT